MLILSSPPARRLCATRPSRNHRTWPGARAKQRSNSTKAIFVKQIILFPCDPNNLLPRMAETGRVSRQGGTTMRSSSIASVVLVAIVVLAAAAPSRAEDTIAVASYGGAYQEA